MLKRLIAILLLVLPLVNADITLEPLSKNLLNLGDKINVIGTIIRQEDTQGLLKFDLICSETKQLLVKSISIQANVVKNFNEQVSIVDGLTGNCNIKVYLDVNGNVLEEDSTSNFEITKDLNGEFTLNKESWQLGQDIEITGKITKKEGTSVDGIAEIIFKTNDQVVFSKVVDIKNGNFKYIYETKENPSGDYIRAGLIGPSITAPFNTFGLYHIKFEVNSNN